MNPRFIRILFLSLAVAALAAGCNRHTVHDSSAAPSAAVRHALRGVVVSVDAAANTALVQHEEIPGFMGAMTMQFGMDAAVARTLAPQQKITATLVQTDAGFQLEDVKIVTP